MIPRKKTVTPEKALSRLEDLCSRSEHCTGEARKKMREWGLSPSEIEKIIDSLVSRRFIDDTRFCEAYVNEKIMFANWGRRKIYAALILKQVDRAIIKEALDSVDEDAYFANLKRIIDYKARTMPDSDTYEGRTRLFRYAASKGFEPDLIAKAIKSLR